MTNTNAGKPRKPRGGDAQGRSASEVTLARVGTWLAICIGVLIVGLIISALLPRWWAEWMGNLIDGRIIFGSGLGVAVGAVFGFAALESFGMAWRTRERKALATFWLIVAGIATLPNLLTLWIVLGASSAAHAGQRVLDVDGPGFRGGTLVGFLVALAAFGILTYLRWARLRRKRLDQAEKDRQGRVISELAAEARAEREAPVARNGKVDTRGESDATDGRG